MSRLKQLLHEIHRRSLWQVLGIYVGGSWLLLQVVDTLAGALNLPDWAPSLALFLLIVGLPIVLATAFVQSRAGDGARASGPTPSRGPEVAEEARPQPVEGGARRFLTWRIALLGGMGAFALWGVVAAGWLVFGASRGPSAESGAEESTSPNVVAVLPFIVRGSEEYRYLGQGLVNLLSTKLDGAGDLRTVDPSGLLAVVEREGIRGGDPQTADRIARQFGAGLFVTGDIVEARDQLQVNAGLYRTGASTERIGEGTAEREADEVFDLVDEVAAELLTSSRSGASARVQRVAGVTTSSLSAYKAFLEGESLLRRGQFGPGVEAFQRAVAEDSLFALAHYRLSMAAEWNLQDSLARAEAELAFRHSGRLSEQDRRLLDAFLVRRRGANEEAEEKYRSILSTYPDDVEAWLDLVEILFHANPLRARSFTAARDPLERVLFFEPTHSTSLIHLSRLAAFEGELVELDSLADKFVALSPSPERSLEIQSLRAFAKRDTAQIESIVRGLERTTNDLSVALSVWDVAVFSRDLGGGVRLAELLSAPSRSREARVLGHAYAAHLHLAAGRLAAAREELRALAAVDPGAALEYRGLFSALLAAPAFGTLEPADHSSLLAELRSLDPGSIATSENPSVVFTAHDKLHPLIRLYLLGLVSAIDGDRAAAERYAVELEAVELPETAGSLAQDLAHSIRSATHRAAGRLEQALAELELSRMETWYGQTMASPLYCQAYERFQRAELLYELGRDREALDWYAHIMETSPFEAPYLALSHVRQAEIHDRMGDPEEAATHYRTFVRLWRDADEEFQPRVQAAEARLAELTARPD